jgi:hypothetical protein
VRAGIELDINGRSMNAVPHVPSFVQQIERDREKFHREMTKDE